MYEHFSKDVLKSMDGKRVPLTIGFDGTVIGEAIFRFDEATGNLEVGTRIEDEQVASWLVDGIAKFLEEGP